ncbi:MAG TPA: RNA-binding protein [Bacteroidales bacterium]|nr:RNA-binding protein [Bacteroidales bacterium]
MNLFVANLHPSTKGEDLQKLFSQFGSVISAKVIMDKQTGNSKRYGFVEFSNDEEGNAAIEGLNEKEFQGNQIIVKTSQPKAAEQKDQKI